MNGKVMDHMVIKICKRCGKEIKKEEKAVLLRTFDDKNIYEELYFHLKCWIDDINERLEKRAIELYKTSMNKSMDVLKGMFSHGKGKTESFILQ